MKKTLSFLSTIMVVLSFVSCSSFSSKKVEGNVSNSSVSSEAIEKNESSVSFSFKTVEGNWWHSWGADGYDYVCIQSNKECDYDFGEARNKKGSIVIDNRNKTIAILNNHREVKTFIYDEKNDMLIEQGENYELWRMPQELNEEISEVISTSQEQYNAEIEELDNLVSEIVRLEHQYMKTRDESIAERGEKLCARLRDISHSLENKVNEGKLSIEQQERINEILERLP